MSRYLEDAHISQQAPCRKLLWDARNWGAPLVDFVVSTYGNTSKVDLKIDTLMSLPSIEKENYETLYIIITRNRNGNFAYTGSTS
jgi:hypothetical protein